MPAREGGGTNRGGGRRQRPRTSPSLSLSPVERVSCVASTSGGKGRNGGRRGEKFSTPRTNGLSDDEGAAGPVPGAAVAGADAAASGVGPAEPELLTRFIPADPWVGRVSLSSPELPAGMSLSAAAAAAAGAKQGGGSAGASSTASPSGTAAVNGTAVNEVGGGAQGVVGLVNEGNWCYLNASLQVLARCTPLRAHLLECVRTPDVAGRRCPLALTMSELYAAIWSDDIPGGRRRAAETPVDVLRALVKGNRWFAGNGQHDAHEALRSILDLLHEELRRPVPVGFEPGHAALAAAMAASSAEAAAAAAASATTGTAPATSSPDDLRREGAQPPTHASTTPSTPADSSWGVNGKGGGHERSTERVASGDGVIAQRDVYWQSAAAETFQGMLLGRITCRECGRRSYQPDRFYDLSVPCLATSAGSASAVNGGNGKSPAAAAAATAMAAAAAAETEAKANRHRDSPDGGRTPTIGSPRPEWEPSDVATDLPGEGTGLRRTASIRSDRDGEGGAAQGGEHTSDRGSWRLRRSGWCSTRRAHADDDDAEGGRADSGQASGSDSWGGYLGGLVSSVGVWLGWKSVPLEDCLEAFFSTERLRGTNQYHCDGCGSKKEADKTTSLLHAPEILMLHVKRFRRGYLWSHKVHNRVIFPLHNLDVSRWLSDHALESSSNQRPSTTGTSGGDAHRKSSTLKRGSSPDGGGYYGYGVGGGESTATAAAAAASESVAAAFSPSSPEQVLYDLVGLVQHSGGLEHGHYTSFAREDGSATWHYFNDATVMKVSQEVVSSASPYVLVYRRKRPSSSSSSLSQHPTRSSAASAATATTASLLSSVGIGPAAEEARDVRSRVDILAREMAKAAGAGRGHPPPPGGTGAAAGADVAAGASGDPQPRMSLGGTMSDTDGEGGGGGVRISITRRRKGRGRRPGSESESEGGTGGSNSWVYMSKAWALKWATCAYPGPVSNHHVVCRHGRVKPNVGVKRAAKEMVAVPRGVHRSLVNRYGPRTPAVVAGKSSPVESNGFQVATVPGESASRISVGRGRGRGQGMALVGSSRPLLELSSCTACETLEEQMAQLKATEQKEVAGLSKIGQERRKCRKAARLARQERRSRNNSDSRRGSSGVEHGPEDPTTNAVNVGRGIGGSGGWRDPVEDEASPGRNVNASGAGGVGGSKRDQEGEGAEKGQPSLVADDAAGDVGGESGGLIGNAEGDEEGHGLKEQHLLQETAAAKEENGFVEEGEEGEEETWYLMAGTWLSRWHAYVLSGTGQDLDFPTPPPGPITNGDLVDENSVPIPGKVAGKHYRGAMVEVWSYLHRRYGGGPVICRSNPDGLYEEQAATGPA